MQSSDYYVVGIAIIALVVSLWPRGGLAAWRQADMRQLVQMLVLEAEQTMPGDTGEEKLSWVLDRADEIGITRFIPQPVLSAIIESTVYRIRHEQTTAPSDQLLQMFDRGN